MLERGYRDLFFWDLFFQRNYLFVEDSLTMSIFPLTVSLVPPSRPHHRLHPYSQEYVGVIPKYIGIFLTNPYIC